MTMIVPSRLPSAAIAASCSAASISVSLPVFSPEESNGPQLLDQLAEITGGRHFPVLNVGNLPEVSARIGQLLRNRYLLGYNPTNASRDGRYRGIHLDLAAPPDPGVHVQYRKGYYAPLQ